MSAVKPRIVIPKPIQVRPRIAVAYWSFICLAAAGVALWH